jgi:hypothetical protein
MVWLQKKEAVFLKQSILWATQGYLFTKKRGCFFKTKHSVGHSGLLVYKKEAVFMKKQALLLKKNGRIW